jgi:hypothetical protein
MLTDRVNHNASGKPPAAGRRPTSKIIITFCAAFIGLILCAPASQAQTTCIPRAVGVPFASGPPKWWVSPSPGDIHSRIDDPRWKGASSITFGLGATEEVAFRALHHTEPGEGGAKSIYLSWWIKVAPSPTATENSIYLGLRQSGGNSMLVKVDLTSSSSLNSTDYQVSAHSVDAMGNFGVAFGADPAWTNIIRVWANQPVSNTWAVHVNVPIGTELSGGNIPGGVTLGDDFNMWFEVLEGTPNSTALVYAWPRTGAFVTEVAFVQKLPQPSIWLPFHLSSGAADPACQTGGITIGVIDIGTNHPNGPGYISKTNPNTFFAKPTNKTADPIDIGKVHARFRLANWGIQPDPNDIPNAAANLWKEVPGLGDVTQAGAGQIAANGQWNITGNWTLTPAEQAEFDGVNRWDHQCMLVELSGPGLNFLNNSVHRNMNFVNASVYRENAQVSVKGIPLIPGGNPNRDVYLYVQTFNMPAVVGGNGGGQGTPTPEPTRTPSPDRQAGAVGTPPKEEDERTQVEKLTDTEPTFIVHGYYDSGEKITIKGVSRSILRPLTSYGYFVKHEGGLDGWKHSLTQNGVELTQIAPNFFKLSVPQDGAVTITTNIEALERGLKLPWWIWLLIAILIFLILLLLWWLRRRGRP